MTWMAPNPEVIHTELEDGAVLLNMETGYYYSLDVVGRDIWRLLEEGGSAEAVGAALTERYDVDATRATRTASEFLEKLAEEGLVLPAEADGRTGAGGSAEGSRAASVAATGAPGATEPAGRAEGGDGRPAFREPELLKHDEPLSQMSTHPFDPQLPLAE